MEKYVALLMLRSKSNLWSTQTELYGATASHPAICGCWQTANRRKKDRSKRALRSRSPAIRTAHGPSRITRLFPPSFSSCRGQNFSDAPSLCPTTIFAESLFLLRQSATALAEERALPLGITTPPTCTPFETPRCTKPAAALGETWTRETRRRPGQIWC